MSGTFELTSGTTAVIGDNGQGKTNLAEALAFLATLSSFRSVPGDALVRVGASTAIIRATVIEDDGRESLIEIELATAGRNRVQVNRQRLQRVRDLLGTVRVTVFSPDDLILVKGSPGDRRRFLDDTLVALAVKYDTVRLEVDRIVRQRNTPAQTVRRPSHRRDRGHARRLGREVRRHRRPVRIRPRHARCPTRADGAGGLRTARRDPDADRPRLRTAVALDRTRRRARSKHAPSTSGAGSAPSDRTATN